MAGKNCFTQRRLLSKATFTIILAVMGLSSSCSLLMVDPPEFVGQDRLLYVVEKNLYTSISDDISSQINQINSRGGSAFLELADSHISHSELKDILSPYARTIDSALLIGNLPVAWYEQQAFGSYESFPTDLYFMDFNARWNDSNSNGRYDSHSELNLQIAVSRLNGSASEIKHYFSKVDDYRQGVSLGLSRAFIFKDDDWHDFSPSSSFGLDAMYRTIDINESSGNTNRDSYLAELQQGGADYVYQWIHATAPSLYFDGYDGYERFSFVEIDPAFRARFINMFNCKGIRFTENNLGMSYLTRTDTTLLVTGSTKVGGNYYPLDLHRELSVGNSWGLAFRNWYNNYGKYDDEWFLGMALLGDPTLRIRNTGNRHTLAGAELQSVLPPLQGQRSLTGQVLMNFDQSRSSDP